ncbi:MAG TPA: endo alpha-1,4 polygalactosaminidase [Tepidisphaeraceae bacterium]|jgi:cysteinyl-tRNA synthetase|nr:endo alpha-1,4 polygalactosaminidase [Tepidisphaeraceae bacterium]
MKHARHRLLAALSMLLIAPFAFAGRDWTGVKSWVYQLTNYQNAKLDQIAHAGFDLAVIDLTRDGKEDYFTPAEITAVKQQGVFVLAYFEIGAIENYRPEWKTIPNDLMAAKVKGWPKERLVKYWDDRWWPIVKGRVDQAIKAGYDGAYLDLITAYEELPAKEMTREQLAQKMVALISRLSTYAKSINPNFKIVPQNSPELYNWSYWDGTPNKTYLNAIDGIGIEDVFYLAHDKPASARWSKENRDNALAIKKAGKLVLGVDYAKKPANITDAYAKERAIGFVPYVSTVELDAVHPEPAAPTSR